MCSSYIIIKLLQRLKQLLYINISHPCYAWTLRYPMLCRTQDDGSCIFLRVTKGLSTAVSQNHAITIMTVLKQANFYNFVAGCVYKLSLLCV